MNKMNIKAATQKWVDEFNFVPGSIFEKIAQVDEAVRCYDSDSLRLIASPRIECAGCGVEYDRDEPIEQREQHARYCDHNDGDDWSDRYPEYAFPCGWGTLFAPKNQLDIDWCIENADEIAKLGFFVFESDDWGVLLGLDASGFDFYDAYWIPLYRLRGLQWHDSEE